MPIAAPDLWTLTFGQPWIDPEALAIALEAQAAQPDLDFRTRLLIRDSLNALSNIWGTDRFESWLNSENSCVELREIRIANLGPPGFPTLQQRIMNTLRPQTVLEFLRELGTRLNRPTPMIVGGSIALILSDDLNRATDDINVVDEVPAEIRSQYELLDDLAARYGLRVTHFQSHFLPTGWRERVRSLQQFGNLDVFLIDTCDIFIGKLFSARLKDRDDLRHLIRRLDKARIESRLRSTASSLRAIPLLAKNAEENWYILYGEQLPV